jgi:hypothetical protein
MFMSVNYLFDKNEIPKWQIEMMDERLGDITKDPTSIREIDELFEELNKEVGPEFN